MAASRLSASGPKSGELMFCLTMHPRRSRSAAVLGVSVPAGLPGAGTRQAWTRVQVTAPSIDQCSIGTEGSSRANERRWCARMAPCHEASGTMFPLHCDSTDFLRRVHGRIAVKSPSDAPSSSDAIRIRKSRSGSVPFCKYADAPARTLPRWSFLAVPWTKEIRSNRMTPRSHDRLSSFPFASRSGEGSALSKIPDVCRILSSWPSPGWAAWIGELRNRHCDLEPYDLSASDTSSSCSWLHGCTLPLPLIVASFGRLPPSTPSGRTWRREARRVPARWAAEPIPCPRTGDPRHVPRGAEGTRAGASRFRPWAWFDRSGWVTGFEVGVDGIPKIDQAPPLQARRLGQGAACVELGVEPTILH